jgi:hypothetical protein
LFSQPLPSALDLRLPILVDDDLLFVGHGHISFLCRLIRGRGWLPLCRGFLRRRALAAGLVVGHCRADEPGEEWLRRSRLRLEFRMILHGKKPRMLRQLNHFYQRIVGACARKSQAVRRELVAISIVELVAMAVPFGDFRLAVTRCGRLPGCSFAV